MRIIAGKFRGRKLRTPRGSEIRPTGDRLKESLFNILGSEVLDAVFMDVFAGTGSIGLEALSRGAREIVFVESSLAGVRLIQHNLQHCGVVEGYRVLREDVFSCLRRLGREGFSADIIFLDPPYQWKPYRDLLEIVFRDGLATEGSSVVMEHDRHASLPEAGERYRCIRTVRQGDKCLSIYRTASGDHQTP